MFGVWRKLERGGSLVGGGGLARMRECLFLFSPGLRLGGLQQEPHFSWTAMHAHPPGTLSADVVQRHISPGPQPP